MVGNPSSLAEYRLFDDLESFIFNKYREAKPLKVKKDVIYIPKLPKAKITYIRAKRLQAVGEFLDKENKSILVVHDSSAYAEISPSLYQAVMFRRWGIYAKEQSLGIYADNDRFVVGYHFPHWVTFKFLKQSFKEKRDLDVVYVGKARKQRNDLFNNLRLYCKQMKLNYVITQSKKQVDFATGRIPEGLLGPKQYVELLRSAKLAYSFLGTGYRSHREWEALLSGALLLNDPRSTICCQFKGLEEGKHFINIREGGFKEQLKYWINNDEEREEMARAGFTAAWEIWKDATDHWYPIRKLIAEQIIKNKWL